MNVQITKADLDEAEVVLSDPLPGGAAEAFRYEKADLRAIGEIIYQLVMRKGTVDFEWLILPLEATPEWAAMFGRESTKWLSLCSRLLDRNLSLENVNLESVAAELKLKGKAKGKPAKAPKPAKEPKPPKEPKAPKEPKPPKEPRPKGPPLPWAKIAAVIGVVVVLGGGGYLAVHLIGKAVTNAKAVKKEALKKKYNDDLEVASTALSSGTNQLYMGMNEEMAANLLNARARVKEAVESDELREFRDQRGTDLQAEIERNIEQAYRSATNSAGQSLAKKAGKQAADYASMALSLKPNDPAAADLQKQGKDQVEQELARGAKEKECATARQQAADAEQGDEAPQKWTAARQKWEAAQAKCGSDDKEIQDGIQFAKAMIDASKQLQDANTAANRDQAGVDEALKICATLSNQLAANDLALLATRVPARGLALQQRQAELQKIQSNANTRKANWAAYEKCKQAKDSATSSEARNDWAAAAQAWEAAQAICKDDDDVRAGLAFARSMTNALARLARAKASNVSPADAIKLATNALNDLNEAKRWAKDLNGRTSQITSLTTQATQIKNSAQTAMDTAAAQAKCQEAVATAQKAEQDAKWSDAYTLWQQAQAACGANAEATGGMRFATNMLAVIAALDDAERKAGGNETNATAASDTASKALTQLNSISNLVSSTSRKTEWDARQKRLMAARTRAQGTLDTIQKTRTCEMARASARAAENATNWIQAALKWNAAKGTCLDNDNEVVGGIKFASAMTNALADLELARARGKNGATVTEPAIATLSGQKGLATNNVRSAAFNALLQQLGKAGLDADRALGNEFFTAGNYDDALKVCTKHAELADLKDSIVKERDALSAFQTAFNSGDYSFLDNRQSDVQQYGQRPSFKELLPQARQEKQTLNELTTLQQSPTNWPEVLKRQTAAPTATYWGKTAFSNVLAWAQGQQAESQRRLQGQLAAWDARLEVLEVDFGLLSNRRATSNEAKKAEKFTGPIGSGSRQYLANCQEIENGFKQLNALNSDRTAKLAKVREKISNWDSSF